jgi:hypothetical protein
MKMNKAASPTRPNLYSFDVFIAALGPKNHTDGSARDPFLRQKETRKWSRTKKY